MEAKQLMKRMLKELVGLQAALHEAREQQAVREVEIARLQEQLKKRRGIQSCGA